MRICVSWCCTLWENFGSQCGEVNTTVFCNVTSCNPVAIYGQYGKNLLSPFSGQGEKATGFEARSLTSY